MESPDHRDNLLPKRPVNPGLNPAARKPQKDGSWETVMIHPVVPITTHRESESSYQKQPRSEIIPFSTDKSSVAV
jgi:hypothetical protein